MHFERYLQIIKQSNGIGLANAIKQTVNEIVPQYIRVFSYTEHVLALLMGNIQSGKTSHVFGLITATADEGFGIFVILTTDNIALQQQTLKRANRDLSTFFVCGEDDYTKFVHNNMKKPAVIVLKKNASVLKQWKNNFSSTDFCAGNPLVIIDDEGDAASLNTKVNKRSKSTINRTLEEIKDTTSSSIYIQVTGTPQAILLQTVVSGWNPYFFYYFKPGDDYIGGDFFFSDVVGPHVILTDNEEADEILAEDEFPENGLKKAVFMHLVTSAQFFLEGESVSNFMIHPSFRVSQHQAFAEKVGEYLNDLNATFDEEETIEIVKWAYDNIQTTAATISPFELICDKIKEILMNDKVNIMLMNSQSEYIDSTQYETGINIIVGGNSLGRGVTFPKLQTIYYCRLAKSPQADTMWQHSRMFGYDRNLDYMRVFIPPRLFKLFSDINKTNKSLIAQISKFESNSEIKIYYP